MSSEFRLSSVREDDARDHHPGEILVAVAAVRGARVHDPALHFRLGKRVPEVIRDALPRGVSARYELQQLAHLRHGATLSHVPLQACYRGSPDLA
jgi:hypothetical protein